MGRPGGVFGRTPRIFREDLGKIWIFGIFFLEWNIYYLGGGFKVFFIFTPIWGRLPF